MPTASFPLPLVTSNYKSGDGVWFKRSPVNEDALPNAEFIRPMGLLMNEAVVEIKYRGKLWTVREREICGNIYDYAKKLQKKIEDNTLLGQTKKDLAASLGISYSTLRRWEMLIVKYWEKPTEAVKSPEPDAGFVAP